MYTIQLQRKDVYLRLLEKAKQRGVSLDDVISDLLEEQEHSGEETNPLIQMAAAEAAGLIADRDDISENFDDLLRTAWGQSDDSDHPTD